MGIGDYEIRVTRLDDEGIEGTPSSIVLLDNGEEKASWRGLELPFKNNEKNVSCIPTGEYRLHQRKVGGFAKRAADLFGHPYTFWIKPVEGRDFILVHWGNFLSSTRGCLLIGETAGKQNGKHVVWESKRAYRRFFKATEFIYTRQETIPFIIEDGTCEEEADLTLDRTNI